MQTTSMAQSAGADASSMTSGGQSGADNMPINGAGGQDNPGPEGPGDATNEMPKPDVVPKICDEEQPEVMFDELQLPGCPADHFYVPDHACENPDENGSCPFVCRKRVKDCMACDADHFCLERISLTRKKGVYCHPKAALGARCLWLLNHGSLYKDSEASCQGNAVCREDANGEFRCAAPLELGDACANHGECQPDLACRATDLPDGSSGPYTCQMPAETCYGNDSCARNERCDLFSTTCVPPGVCPSRNSSPRWSGSVGPSALKWWSHCTLCV